MHLSVAKARCQAEGNTRSRQPRYRANEPQRNRYTFPAQRRLKLDPQYPLTQFVANRRRAVTEISPDWQSMATVRPLLYRFLWETLSIHSSGQARRRIVRIQLYTRGALQSPRLIGAPSR